MFDALLTPGRIGWAPAVAATVVLIALGEAARAIAWARDNDADRYMAWSLPFRGNRPRRAVIVAFERLKSSLRPAAVLPLVLAPVPMMRPPADITTAIVALGIFWWLLFASVALVRAQVTLRSAS